VHVSTHVKQTRARNTVQTKLLLAPPGDFGFSQVYRSPVQKNAILPLVWRATLKYWLRYWSHSSCINIFNALRVHTCARCSTILL